MSNKLFSIITISFNQARYLEECILSIAAQGEPVEHIIIDGGSTDESLEVIRKYEDKITYWISENDKGPANALNKGLAKATGTFIGYINSDDYLLPGALSAVRKIIDQNPGYDVYYGSGLIVDANGKSKQTVHPTKWNLGVYRSGLSIMFQQSEFIRRSALKEMQFNESNTTHWDGELLVDLSLQGALFYRFKNIVSAFRIHEESISGGIHGIEGSTKYQVQLNTVNERIDKLRPGLIKFKPFWMLWLFMVDTKLMSSRIWRSIFKFT